MRVVAVQMKAGPDPIQNRDTALRLLEDAARREQDLYVLPEMFAYRGPADGLADAASRINSDFLGPFVRFARQKKAWVLLGSCPERSVTRGKFWNTSFLLDPKGRLIARYRKIHRFRFRTGSSAIDEAKTYLSGHDPVMTRIGPVRAGLSICFDLRFPELFSGYRRKGAGLLLCPSSFTRGTGQDHWEILIRARAIENQCFVVAPNQYGLSGDGILCHGHSLIVDPWGRVLAEGPSNQDAILAAKLDFGLLRKIRKNLPCQAEIRYK